MKILLTLLLSFCLMLLVCAVCWAQKAELVVQTGHSTTLHELAFSPDGKMLASAGYDISIKLWEVATGRQLRSLNGHSDEIFSLVFSRDGKMLASGSADNTIKLWELATGRELHTLTGHTHPISFLAFSADNQTLFSNSVDSTIRQWDVVTGRELRIITKLPNVSKVALSPDGKMLASQSSEERLIRLWDVATGQELRKLTINAYEVSALEFSPDGKMLASSLGVTITLWDVNTGKELRMLWAVFSKPEFLISIAFSRDGKTLAGGFVDGTIKLWNVDSGQELRTLRGHRFRVSSVMFHVDGQILASCDQDAKIKLWETATGRELRSLDPRALRVRSLAISPDDKTIISGNSGQTIKVWDVATGGGLRTLTGRSLALTADGKTLARVDIPKPINMANPIKLWDVASGAELLTIPGHSKSSRVLGFSGDGRTLVSTGGDAEIKLWDMKTGRELRTITRHGIALSRDGTLLAYGNSDDTIQLYDVTAARELRTVKAYSVSDLKFSNDAKILAGTTKLWHSISDIKLWDSGTGRELRTLKGHSESVNSVAFSPDGKILASGSSDQTIKLWDITTGLELRTLTGHSHDVSSVVFSGDGKFLISGGSDATTRLWRVATGELLATLIALDDRDWAVVTPGGLFDASLGARKLMHYIVGMEVVTLDQMKDLYYVPGLLQKIIASAPLPKVELFTAQDLFPETEYQQPKPDQKTFIVKLRNRGGGIGPTQVLVNGTEIIADARPAGFDPQAKEATLTINLSNVKQLLPGQENKVEVITRNAAGSLSSKDSTRGVKVVFAGDGKALTEPPELYAIIGGVSRYAGDQLNLRYSAKDAEDFARALEIGATKLLSRDKVHIRLLTSQKDENRKLLTIPDSSELSPSKENFRKVFAEFAGKAKQNDILIVYLSGHGVALARQGGDSYLYLSEEAHTTDTAVLSDEKIRTGTTVSSEELVQWIKEIPTLKKALVLDTCAAGAAAESLLAKKDVPSDQIRALERLKDRTGFFVLMGSAADKVSYETTTYRQGLLTYSLLEGLKGAKLHSGGYANVGQLFDYAQDRVPQLARHIGAIQQPRSLAPDIGSPFDIGLYTADEQERFSLPSPHPLILRPSLQNKDLGYDNLKLLPVLHKALEKASYVVARGRNESSLVFIDASEMPDAFMPVGSYTVVNNNITINLNLLRNDKPVAKLVVEGPVSDEPSKAAIVQKLIVAISAETRKSLQ